jgi:hypothetical protein
MANLPKEGNEGGALIADRNADDPTILQVRHGRPAADFGR